MSYFVKLIIQVMKRDVLLSRRVLATSGNVASKSYYSSEDSTRAPIDGNDSNELHMSDDIDGSFRLSNEQLEYFIQRRIFNTLTLPQLLRCRTWRRKCPHFVSPDTRPTLPEGRRDDDHVPVIVREMLKEQRDAGIEPDVPEKRSGEDRRRLKNRVKHILQIQSLKYPFAQAVADAGREDNDGCEVGTETAQHMANVFGTPNPLSGPSRVTCSGCGAVLHCQDSADPGYIPSELFESCSERDLHHTVCQRCTFLGHFDVALKVSVRPEDYVSVISQRVEKERRALVLLMVDLTDFPCSIWPGIVDVIGGERRPLVVVGNKVDLLPRDGRGHLDRVTASLVQSLKDCHIDRGTNIKHVCLISAKTGFGVEELITKLQNTWGTKGDIFLVGCTNVGKSSLFNALLHSDLCKTEAMDLIHQATTSIWPGTTLNLLKFPILYPNRKRLHLRVKRLMAEMGGKHQERKYREYQLEQTNDPEYATLIGHIGSTFTEDGPNKPKPFRKPFDPTHIDYAAGRWLYDTPGVVHSDQITSFLTLNELALTLPKSIINPRCVVLKPRHTFFLAGLGRIDHVEGSGSARLMVFSSNDLPLSVTPTEEADEFYWKFLGTPVLAVPEADSHRLDDFPDLVEKEIVLTGTSRSESCADIVLSSAGWCSVCLQRGSTSTFLAYTPGGLGVNVRMPAMLPLAISLCGNRISYTPFCGSSKVFLQ